MKGASCKPNGVLFFVFLFFFRPFIYLDKLLSPFFVILHLRNFVKIHPHSFSLIHAYDFIPIFSQKYSKMDLSDS